MVPDQGDTKFDGPDTALKLWAQAHQELDPMYVDNWQPKHTFQGAASQVAYMLEVQSTRKYLMGLTLPTN